ncbi:hypothetical protein [Sinorhizobium fredii]|uniref:hypothetical protein n=1 Tax=Rhizobium fredii TaxID=380 RepID=UPI003515BA21
MVRISVITVLLFAFCNAASAETQFVTSERQLVAIPVNVTGVLNGPRSRGWHTRTAFYKALGDRKCVFRNPKRPNVFNMKCNFSGGDRGFYMQPFSSAEEARLEEVQGVWTCYRRDRENSTAGAFKFGVNDRGKRYAVVNRSRQLKKGTSGDFKKFIEAGKVVAVALGIYRGDPAGGVQDAKAWESAMKTLDGFTNTSKRRDMTPTVIKGQERWVREGSFSITVKRYYNCTIDMRFKNK